VAEGGLDAQIACAREGPPQIAWLLALEDRFEDVRQPAEAGWPAGASCAPHERRLQTCSVTKGRPVYNDDQHTLHSSSGRGLHISVAGSG
jgi:hypothetical protein